MRAEKLIDILLRKLRKDWDSRRSMLRFYLMNNWGGGWESWLQTTYAKQIFYTDNANITQFDREIFFPGTALKCDLWFRGGADIWIELKTQRNRDYTKTVLDFMDDIAKFAALDRDFRATNVLVAAAILRLGTHAGVTDQTRLQWLLTHSMLGKMHYYVLTDDGWKDQTAGIQNQATGTLVCATFVPSA